MNLTSPYPFDLNVKRNFLITFLISLFVGLFLCFFQPFGSYQIETNYKYFILSGYGAVTFVVLIIDLIALPLLLPKIFSDKHWKILHQIFWLLWILFTIGLANFFYTMIIFGPLLLDFSRILTFQLYTLAIGIIPITILILLNYNHLLHKNLAVADKLNMAIGNKSPVNTKPDSVIQISSVNDKETIQTTLNDLLFIRSEGNYIDIYFLDNETIKRKLIRNTLKQTAELLHHHFPPLFKTHRSYIVNMLIIQKVKGNSQGLQLYLNNFDELIPVSRAFIKPFNEYFTQS